METPFHIFEITPEVVAVLHQKREDSHLHNFEELIILTEGGLSHFIDFQEEEVLAPAASYVSMGKMHRVVEREDLRGWVINYQSEFIPDSGLSFYSNFFTTTSVPLKLGGCTNRFVELCRIIQNEYLHETPDMTTIRFLVSGLIAMVETERRRNLPVENSAKASQVETFRNFLRILEDNFRRAEGVVFYATKMNMSERNLNIICKNNFGKSVSEIIETRKLIEAKNLLIYTEKTVSEIGFELGYNEKSYFTRVFRTKISMTPTEYRDLIRRMLA